MKAASAARQTRLVHQTGLEEVVEPRTDPVVEAHQTVPGVAVGQTGLVVVQAEVDTVLGVVGGHIVLEVDVGHIVPEAVVDTVQERHSLGVVEELRTGPGAGRHSDSAAAHHIGLGVAAGRSLAEAGSHRTADFALAEVDGSLAVEVVDIADADRILGVAGLL